MFKTTSFVLVHQLSVSFWFFLLHEGQLLLPAHGFCSLVRSLSFSTDSGLKVMGEGVLDGIMGLLQLDKNSPF